MPAAPSTPTRVLSAASTFILRALRYAPVMKHADAGPIIDRECQAALNLPGRLAFFPERATNPRRIEALLDKLRPRLGGPPLIRLGPNADGGYLVPDDLQGVVACFSPGVNTTVGFELDCATRGLDVHLADASVAGPPVPHPRFHFTRKFLGAVTQREFMTLEDWVRTAVGPLRGDLMLQMDIEGYEYETLLATPKSVLERFRIIVIEFHYLDRLFSEPLYQYYASVFEKLLQTFACVHIHPNNVCPILTVKGLEMVQMAEFTFLRRDRVTDWTFATHFPHPLDRDNVRARSVTLPPAFYRRSDHS